MFEDRDSIRAEIQKALDLLAPLNPDAESLVVVRDMIRRLNATSRIWLRAVAAELGWELTTYFKCEAAIKRAASVRTDALLMELVLTAISGKLEPKAA